VRSGDYADRTAEPYGVDVARRRGPTLADFARL